MTLGAESFQSVSYVTTTNHNFISSGLTFITMLGSSSSTPQSKQYVYLQVGRIFHCNGRVSDMIQDDKKEQENDDENLGG